MNKISASNKLLVYFVYELSIKLLVYSHCVLRVRAGCVTLKGPGELPGNNCI